MKASIATGVVVALVAAAAFGVTAPVIAWAGRDVGPLATASLLYAGAAAAAVSLLAVTRTRDARLRRGDLPRLLAIGIAGAAIAPTLMAWGLQRAGGFTGALLLNLEAVFTVLLARVVYREHVGGRVALAVACMAAGGAVLVLGSPSDGFGTLGALAVTGSTLAWAFDNTWTRPLAERDPWQVVAVKAAIGAALTFAVAAIRGESAPTLRAAAILLACGATGYGASLRLYLAAQRRLGAARTGSVFAVAPFIGAALAWAIGNRSAGGEALAAVALFALGVVLHIGEHHHHEHTHTPVDHEHMHRHDDGHHDHVHDPPFFGEHSHAHHHGAVTHDHEHAPDLHHDHH
jgi:drug/metabolite transporter (DMT)-like permease